MKHATDSHVVSVDFGTSFTAAALRRNGAVDLVDIDGTAQKRIPSSVYLDELTATYHVGQSARNLGLKSPDAFERTPKRLIGAGEVLLGSRLVRVEDLAHAVYRRVLGECRADRDPDELRITHPAEWPPGHIEVLRVAAEAAASEIGWNAPLRLLPEPVAAAVEAASYVPTGSAVAVYDLGGGTFDAAVVRRSVDGFEVVGQPGGQDRCGGEEFDDMLVHEIGRQVGNADAWRRLLDPPLDDVALQRARTQLRAAVVSAKEELSFIDRVVLTVPTVDTDVEITRTDFESLIAPKIRESVTILLETIGTASRAGGLGDADFAGVVLTGGSSRIPLVERLISQQTKLRVFAQPDRKGVVAAGAARWIATPGDTEDAPAGLGARSAAAEFSCRLAVHKTHDWRTRRTKVVVGAEDLVIQEYQPEYKSLQRWAELTRRCLGPRTAVAPGSAEVMVGGHQGAQLWMLTTRQDGSAATHLHRCALTSVNGGARRALEIVALEHAADLADQVRLGKLIDGVEYTPLSVLVPAQASVREQVSVIVKGRLLSAADTRALAESAPAEHLDEDAWAELTMARYGSARVTEVTAGTFLEERAALYREVSLGSPRAPIGALWAYWWTGIVEDRAVAIAVESRSRLTRERTERLRDLFTLVPAPRAEVG